MIYLGIISILIILAVLLIPGKSSKYKNEGNVSNPENVISPLSNNDLGYETPVYSSYFENLSNQPLNNIVRYVYNWQVLFDMFASNKANVNLKYEISSSNLQKLSSRIQRTQQEFFKGSSDDIIKTYGKVIKEEAGYYKLDWRLIISIIRQESDFTSNAVSHAGAYGFMQIMPRTGSSLEQTLNLENHTSPTNNLIAGIYYYALLVGRYDEAGDPDKYMLALAAYNCGSGHVEDAMSISYYEGKDFLKWENISNSLTKLGPNNDSLHVKIWKSKPPNGSFTNWREPVNYVFNIMYYWSEYKKIYPIAEDKPKSSRKKKAKKQ